MDFLDRERIGLFIDGARLHAMIRTLGFDLDFKRLLLFFRDRGILVRAHFYVTIHEGQEFSSIRPLLDWLEYNGFMIVTKPRKEFVDSNGRRSVKGSMNIELAVDALKLAPHLDHIVIFSSDGDLRALIAALKENGKRVSVVSTWATERAMTANELRRQADQFIDIADLESIICRV